MPLNWERDRRAPKDAEVVAVAVVSVFPDVLTGENQVAPKSLLQPGMKLIAPARAEGRRSGRVTTEQWIQYS